MKNTKITQQAAAFIMGMNQPDISAAINGRINLGRMRAKKMSEVVGGCPMIWMFSERAGERPGLWAAYQEAGNVAATANPV